MKLQPQRSVKASNHNSEVAVNPFKTGLKDVKENSAHPIAIRSILVPIDFSDESRQTLALATQYARTFGAKIILIHVAEPAGLPDFSNAFPLELSTEEITTRCKRDLAKLERELAIEAGLVSSTLVRHGRAWEEICIAAKASDVDLIIISTHGRTGMKHLLMGSTAERVVRHASCPVLVVRVPKVKT